MEVAENESWRFQKVEASRTPAMMQQVHETDFGPGSLPASGLGLAVLYASRKTLVLRNWKVKLMNHEGKNLLTLQSQLGTPAKGSRIRCTLFIRRCVRSVGFLTDQSFNTLHHSEKEEDEPG